MKRTGSGTPSGRARIGIDVGGTFTHGVILDPLTLEVVYSAALPTTHAAPDGVAQGIRDLLAQLLDRGGITVDQIDLVAHSTTQATNALLEGDTAKVGILGLGRGLALGRAHSQTCLDPVPLGHGRFLETIHGFLDLDRSIDAKRLDQAFDALMRHGAEVIVVSAAFGTEDGSNEIRVLERAADRGIPATAASSLSKLYGLQQRTRTAVVNASILPRMLAVARDTQKALDALGIAVPLMIMRSDAGIMDAAEMQIRPIQTILSGPAAGVAAALRFAGVSDAIFIEVGGTSTDVSLIRDGKARERSARIGGQALHVRTLDVRTIGVAGGSLPWISGGKLAGVGPRSAHILGARYACFSDCFNPRDLEIELVEEGAGGYLVARHRESGDRIAFTPTCAANLLGEIESSDAAYRGQASAYSVAEVLGVSVGIRDPKEFAQAILRMGVGPIQSCVKALMIESGVDRDLLTLVGGGGGAGVWTRRVAWAVGLASRIVEHAPIISAIGVAAAMMRESIERSIVDPSEADVLSVRREAVGRLEQAGCSPETMQVDVFVDPRRNIVRATVTGSARLETRQQSSTLTTAQLENAVVAEMTRGPTTGGAASGGGPGGLTVVTIGETDRFVLFEIVVSRSTWLKQNRRDTLIRVVDRSGVTRMQRRRALYEITRIGDLEVGFDEVLDEASSYGDAGRELPDVVLVFGSRIVDLAGLVTEDQIRAVARTEVAGIPPNDPLYMIVVSAS